MIKSGTSDLPFILRTKKIHISASVWFEKSFSYYNTGYKIIDDYNSGTKLSDIWIKAEDQKFDKIIARKQVLERDIILAHSICQL